MTTMVTNKNEAAVPRTIGIVGSGTMGSQIAALFKFIGHEVIVFDIAPPLDFEKNILRRERLLSRNAEVTSLKLVSKGTCSLATNLSEMSHCSMIIECIAETLEGKISLLKHAEEYIGPSTVLATNTSSLSVKEMSKTLSHPDRLIGLHFFNPIHATPLVEMCILPETSALLISQTTSLLESVGRTVIVLPDTPGFVVNRLLFLMIASAIQMIEEDNLPPESVDVAMKTGANMPMGPLELADLIGLDVCLMILTNLFQRTNNASYSPPRLLKELVDAGHLGKKNGHGFYSKQLKL